MRVSGNMASKYLGTFRGWDFYIATASGDYRDEGAVREIQRGRYDIITNGRIKPNGDREPVDIFCTAIDLDHETGREVSHFDDLPSTFHIYSLGNNKGKKEFEGKIGSVCSCALESQERVGGVAMGLPHENRVSNGYPEGFDLDEFRERYEYGGEGSTAGQRVELFRHFKPTENWGDRASSLGIYRGAFHEFVTQRRKRGETPVTKWLFCSKPGYYKGIYRPFGAMVNQLLLAGVEHDKTHPTLDEIEFLGDDGTMNSGGLIYSGIPVSYRYPIKISKTPDGEKDERWFDFMTLTVDCDRASDIVKADKSFKNHPELSEIAYRVIVEDLYNEHHDNHFDNIRNNVMKRLAKVAPSKGWNGEDLEEPYGKRVA